ncbi:GDSL esterase/lipase [Nymphaea thermarum]|nr:GDSL esterase/lipase [Nymphaea thermarum]
MTARGVLASMLWLLVCGSGTFPAGCVAGKVPAVIVFGDSTVDPGNNNQIDTVLKSDFEPYGRDFFQGRPTGRFSNGRLGTDFVGEFLGVKPAIPAYLDPMYNISDFATGVSFASAGTGYDNATSDVLDVIPLWQEVEYFKDYQKRLKHFLGEDKATKTINGALYLISIGTNDFLENYFAMPQRRTEFSVEEYEDFLVKLAAGFIRQLHSLGARKICLSGIAPMGCLPLERTTNFFMGSVCIEELNEVALAFNAKLGAMVKTLNLELPDMRLTLSNPYDVLLEAIRKPSLHGFDVVSLGCCSTGLLEMGYLCNKLSPYTCADADKYVFWDAFHPTEKMNRIFAQHLLNDLPPLS